MAMASIFFFVSIGFLALYGHDSSEFMGLGLNAFEKECFEEGVEAFQKAETESLDPFNKASASLYHAKCLLGLKKISEAKQLLDGLDFKALKASPALFHEWQYTQGKAAFQARQWEQAVHWLEQAHPKRNADLASWNDKTLKLLSESYLILSQNPELTLEERQRWAKKAAALPSYPKEEQAPPLLVEAKDAFISGNYAQALKLYSSFLKQDPDAPGVDEALYWSARCQEQLGLNSTLCYQDLSSRFPYSSYAAEAYFFSYPISEYIEGQRGALKHLQKMPDRFPDSPETLKALYLLGLDATRDRRSPEGKVITRKDLTLAIDRFQELETRYERLLAFDALPKNSLPEWEEIKNRAMLKRADVLFRIAEQAQGAKQQIYLGYAEEIYKKLLDSPFSTEVQFALASTWLKQNQLEKARTGFQNLVEKFPKNSENYYLALSYKALGDLALKEGRSKKATEYFQLALSSGKNLLSIDEELGIKIENSIALQKNGEEDLAMQQLSEVVNYNAVSHLRLKAMFMRAELYALQNKRIQARKQLESLALKSGPWAEKAKEKLEQDYGFN